MATSLPREPVGNSGIFPVNVAGAVSSLGMNHAISVDWKVTPPVEVVAADVQRLGMDIRSFRTPLEAAVKMVLIPSIRKNFDSGGRPAWEPLAAGTIIRRGLSAWPILDRSGRLKRRATQLNIWTITTTTAAVTGLPQDVFYGAFHQAGAARGTSRKHPARAVTGASGWSLPSRPFIMYQPEDVAKIEELFMAWMTARAIQVGRFSGA